MGKPQRRLTPDDWARAALGAMARGGVDAIAVETIAADLGATKGSFYWHFKNRDALIEAALRLWEQTRTEAVIELLESVDDPGRRLRMVMEGGVELGRIDRAEISLLANPGHPAVVRAVRRVARRRISYMSDQLEALGWPPTEARARAVLLYYVYVGHMQMTHVAPRLITAEARRRQVEVAFDALVTAGVAAPARGPKGLVNRLPNGPRVTRAASGSSPGAGRTPPRR